MKVALRWSQIDLFKKGLLLGGAAAILFLLAPYLGISAAKQGPATGVYFDDSAPVQEKRESTYAAGGEARRETPAAKHDPAGTDPTDSSTGESKGLAELEELLK